MNACYYDDEILEGGEYENGDETFIYTEWDCKNPIPEGFTGAHKRVGRPSLQNEIYGLKRTVCRLEQANEEQKRVNLPSLQQNLNRINLIQSTPRSETLIITARDYAMSALTTSLLQHFFPSPIMSKTSTNQPINFSDPYFWASIAFAFINPIAWNVIARLEYRTGAVSGCFGGSKRGACYAFAAFIFTLGVIRDLVFQWAVNRQPSSDALFEVPMIDAFAMLCLGIGSVLVTSSMWKLGIINTYLGDHFGFLLKERITTFPFSVAEHPMYYGATLCFLSYALRMKSPAGLLLTATVALSYSIAANYEGKFTTRIYAKAHKNKNKKL